MEWWRDVERIHKYICKLKIWPVYSRSRIRNFPNDVVPSDFHNHIGHFGYHLCELLIFKKEVQVHLAFVVFGQGSTAVRDCVLLADYVNFTISGILLKLKGHAWSSSNAELPRNNLLVGLAHVPCCSNIIFYLNIRVYLIDRRLDNFLTQNDDQPADCKTELHG